MATTYNADGSIASDGTGLGGLLEAVLGKQVDTNTTSTQDTNAATTQTGATTGSTTANQTAATTGTTSQDTTATGTNTSNTSGTQLSSGSQNTSGTTLNQGTSSTTGTVGTTTNTNTNTNQNQQTSADIGRLQEVYGKQAAGITPEMLAAIFQQGSKQAPNLVAAQAGALGARSVGNTPMARVLNQLNGDMTSKAADINRQMLSDSGTTAAQIADFTRNINTTGSSSSTSVANQVQDLITKTDSRAIVNQLLQSLNQTQSNQQQTGTSTSNQSMDGTNSSNQTSASTGTSAGTSSMDGTQTQQTSAAEQKLSATTINKAMTGDLLKLAAAGVGVNELFKVATGKGFVGNLATFQQYLQSTGASVDLSSGSVLVAPDWETTWGSTGVSDPYSSGSTLTDSVTSGGDWNPADYTDSWAYADGGHVDFLPVDTLIKKQAVIGNPDADIENMLNSLQSPSKATASASKAPGTATGSGGTNNVSASGNYGSGDGSEGSGDSGNPGQIGHGTTGLSNQQAGMIGGVLTALTGIPGLSVGLQAVNMGINTTATEGVSAVSKPVAPQTVLTPTALAPMQQDATGGEGGSTGFSGAAGDTGNGAGYGGYSSDSGSSGLSGTTTDGGFNGASYGGGFSGGNIGGFGGDSSGGGFGGDSSHGTAGYADGGEVDASGNETIKHEETESATSDDDEMMNAIGITRGTEKGSLVFNTQAIKMMHHVLTAKMKAPGSPQKLADGGPIRGPGTGISDSIPATGPGGRKLRVANGEYILPADVTQQVGVDALDALVAKLHVPADLQRAVTGG